MIFFDEKFDLNPVDSVILETFTTVKTQFEALGREGRISEGTACFYQSFLVSNLEGVFHFVMFPGPRTTEVPGK